MSDQWTHINGRLTQDPKDFTTSKGDLTKFGLAVTSGWGKDEDTVFYDVAVWNDGLRQFAKAQLYKGAPVAVDGPGSVNSYEGKDRLQIKAENIGLIHYGTRTKKGETVKAAPAADAADDLNF